MKGTGQQSAPTTYFAGAEIDLDSTFQRYSKPSIQFETKGGRFAKLVGVGYASSRGLSMTTHFGGALCVQPLADETAARSG